MTLPKNTEEIDGLEVRTVQLDVTRSLPMWIRVMNVLAPLFECLEKVSPQQLVRLKAMIDKPKLTQADAMNLLPVIAPFLHTLDADAFMRVAREVLVSTSVMKVGPDGKKRRIELNGQDAKIRDAFGTSLITLIKTLWFVGQVNFRSFSSAGASDDTPPADEPSTSEP